MRVPHSNWITTLLMIAPLLRRRSTFKFGLLNSTLDCPFAFQVFDDAPVSVRSEGAGVCRHATLQKLTHLVDQSVGKMFFSSSVNAFVKLCARRIEREDSQSRCDVRRR